MSKCGQICNNVAVIKVKCVDDEGWIVDNTLLYCIDHSKEAIQEIKLKKKRVAYNK